MFIHKAESFRGGWGIMLDDILAGIYASIILNILLLKL
jgi:phosphatidylglycerophosphatase A